MIRPRPKPLPNQRSKGKEFMTVCVAAFAADLKVIVCVADKAVSYASGIQWDSDSSKIIKLDDSGNLAMIAGNEEHTSRVLANILEIADQISKRKKREIIRLCEQAYKEAMEELVEANVLSRRLINRKDYLSAIAGAEINDYIHSIAKEEDKFEMDCDLLICGFDVDGSPFILQLTGPGVVGDMTLTGFHAI